VLPPTTTLTVKTTLTNCGTVSESGVAVTASVTLSDPPGVAPPSAGSRGGTRNASVTLASGGSAALVLGPIPVAGGHQYLVTISIVVPPGEVSLPQGSSQQFLVQITTPV